MQLKTTLALLFIFNHSIAANLESAQDQVDHIVMNESNSVHIHKSTDELRGYAVDIKHYTTNGTVQPFESYAFNPRDFDNIVLIKEHDESNLRPFSLAWSADKSTLYGAHVDDDRNYYLIRVNPSNGVTTRLSKLTGYNVATEALGGMTIDENNQCYIITTDNQNHDTVSTLYKCNLANGAMSLVGSQSTAPDLHDIAATCDGEMFGIDSLSATLYKIDKSNGAATEVGPLNNGNYNFFDLDFDRKNKKLYHMVWSSRSSSYSQIETRSGQSRFIAGSSITGLLVGSIKSSCSDQPDQYKLNTRFNGSWYNPDYAGQGLLIDVLPQSNTFFGGWFTYDETQIAKSESSEIGSPDQIWYSLQGPLGDDLIVNLEIKSFQGGRFNQGSQLSSEVVGSMTISFYDCDYAEVEYSLTDSGQSGSFPIKRIASDNVDLCESMLE